jgi:hypothetical protein
MEFSLLDVWSRVGYAEAGVGAPGVLEKKGLVGMILMLFGM